MPLKRANCPKCTGYMLVDQLRCTQPGCSGGIIMVPENPLERLANDVLPKRWYRHLKKCLKQ